MMLVQLILAYTMFFTSYNGDVFALHRVYSLNRETYKYGFLGGYSAFGMPFANISTNVKGLRSGLFFLSSGKMDRTDQEGHITGTFYYNALILYAGKMVFDDDKKGRLFIEPSVYLETADGWYNPGLGISLYYNRAVHKLLSIYFTLRNLGLSLNPLAPVNFQTSFTLFYALKGINPYLTLEFTPYGGVSTWSGLSIPLHKALSIYAGYTSKYREMKFGGGEDILNGLYIGCELNPGFVTLDYFADFYGEGGITHLVEVRLSR